MTATYCYWSVATEAYGALMENCVRTARAAGVFKEFHVLTDRSLEGCECYDAMHCDKAHGLFKLHYLKVGMSRLTFDYFIWLDADTVFVRNPVDILGPLGKSPLHVPLEVNLSALENDANWKGVSMFALRDLFRRQGVMNQVYLSQSAFWIVHREAIETVYDLAMRFWNNAKDAGLLLDVSAALGYVMQILCAEPEKHLLVSAPGLWASDESGYFDERACDGAPWPWQHRLAAAAIQIRPAIIHLGSSRADGHWESPEHAIAISSKTDKMVSRARECSLNGDHLEALLIYERLTEGLGRNAGIWFEYGIEAVTLFRFDLAERAWQTACELAPQDAELFLQIGRQCQAAYLREKARVFYQRAAALNSRAINPIIGLALLYEESNSLPEAREAVLQCLAISPRDEQALYLHARLDRREGNVQEAERQFRDLIGSDPTHPRVRYASRFELANILDKRGNVEEAMKLLGEAKELVRVSEDAKRLADRFHAEAEAHLRLLRTVPRDILRVWAQADPKNHSEAIPRMALLGGHPRSGTTLLEQILGAQGDIAAFDEPLIFVNLIHPHMKKKPEVTSALRNLLRKTYIQGLQNQPGTDTEGKLLLDKNPSLTLFLPALLQLFPELRVIIALRDPRDVALSCYFLNLPTITAPNATFLSFEGIARHYAALMETWLRVRDWEGFEWTESRYEDTVADADKEGRRVTAFLGLPWNEKQALFYESAKSSRIYSPTYDEVTKPIYCHSVARWHAYERYLAPILPALKPYCQAFGYE